MNIYLGIVLANIPLIFLLNDKNFKNVVIILIIMLIFILIYEIQENKIKKMNEVEENYRKTIYNLQKKIAMKEI